MGKSIHFTGNLNELANTILSSSKHKPFRHRNRPHNTVSLKQTEPKSDFSDKTKLNKRMEGTSVPLNGNNRMPLGVVVSDCAKRWFHDTLKEAKAGDVTMQVLVAQMYRSGYGVAQDNQKGRAWINRASKTRPSVLGLINKRPGCNASDSDSDEEKDAGK